MIVNTQITIGTKDLLCVLLHHKPDYGCPVSELMEWNELVESFRAVLIEKHPDSRNEIKSIFKEILDV